MHHAVAIPSLVAVASLGIWTGGNAARHIDLNSIVLDGPYKEISTSASLPAFIVTIKTSDGEIRHVAADIDATVRGLLDQPGGMDRLSDAVMLATVKVMRDPATAEADGTTVVQHIADVTNEKLDGSVTALHVKKLTVFDQTSGARESVENQ